MGLPPPLSKQENHELLEKAKAGDPAAKELFFAHNMRLIYFVANKFNHSHLSYEDRVSAAQFGLLKAYNTFDFNKDVNFATYSTRCMDNEILMALRKIKHEHLQSSLDATLHADADGNELTILDTLQSVESQDMDNVLERDNLSHVLTLFNDKATELERRIVHMRFVEEKTQREIAKSLKLSQSYMSRVENRAIGKLRKITKSIQGDVSTMGRKNNTEIDVAKLRSLIESKTPMQQLMAEFGLSEGMYYYYKKKFQKEDSRQKAAEVAVPKIAENDCKPTDAAATHESKKNESAATEITINLASVDFSKLEDAVKFAFGNLDSTKKYTFQLSISLCG